MIRQGRLVSFRAQTFLAGFRLRDCGQGVVKGLVLVCVIEAHIAAEGPRFQSRRAGCSNGWVTGGLQVSWGHIHRNCRSVFIVVGSECRACLAYIF